MFEATIDDRNFRELWKVMGSENQRRLVRRTMGAVMRRALKETRQLTAEKFGGRNDVAKTVRGKVYTKNRIGFKIYTSPKERRAMHENRSKKLKPVAFWANLGTVNNRMTKNRIGRKAGYRGQMPRYNFLCEADKRIGNSVNEDIKRLFVSNAKKIAKKYGCEV